MSRRVGSSNSVTNFRSRRSFFGTLFEFVTCPFVWIRDQISSIRGRRNLQAESEALVNHLNQSNVESSSTGQSKEGKRSKTTVESVDNRDSSSDIKKGYSSSDNKKIPQTETSSCLPEASFIFFGLGGSGISTTAAILFGFAQDDSSATDVRDIYFREISEQPRYSSPTKSQKMNLKIIDVPGLCKGSYIEEDAEIITGLNIHLKQSLANHIPSVAFIVTRFDDNRFEGEASQFSKMLTALSYSRKYWTDSELSNVSLLLTFRSKLDDSEIPNKISRFQQAFSQVYSNIPCIDCTVVNLDDISNLKTQLISAISRIKKRRNDSDNVPKEFLTFLSQEPGRIQPNKIESISLQSLLPQNEREVKTLLVSLLQGKVNEHLSSELNEDEDELCPFLYDFLGKRSQIAPLSLPVAVSFLPPDSKVLLCDGKTQIEVQSLRVGDKLLDRNLTSNVITSIEIIETCTSNHKGLPVGLILVGIKENEDSASEDNENEWRSSPMVLKYQNHAIRHIKFKESAFQNYKSHNRLFIINLDTHNATCIVDNHVLYARYDSALAI